MGHIFNDDDVLAYGRWASLPDNRYNTELESALMLNMLNPTRGETVLEIGCGTGSRLFPFLEAGLHVTGIDPSRSAIDIASKKTGHRVDFYQGFAEDLPFDDNSFNYTCLVKTLEFVKDPQKAIEEACRVAKDRVFIGAVNRQSILGLTLRMTRLFRKTLYDDAHFFSIWELKRIIRTLSGDVPISWRTICRFSAASGRIARWFQNSGLTQRCPFGAFTGMTIILMPRFRTRPLELQIPFCAPVLNGGAEGFAHSRLKKGVINERSLPLQTYKGKNG